MPAFTSGDKARLKSLMSEEEQKNWVSEEESTERTKLIFLRSANTFYIRVKMVDSLLNDEEEDTPEEIAIFEKMKANYKRLAIQYFKAFSNK